MTTEQILEQLHTAFGFELTLISDIEAHMQAHFPPSYRATMTPAEEMVGAMYAKHAFTDAAGRLVGLNLYDAGLKDEQLRLLQELELPDLVALNLCQNQMARFVLGKNMPQLTCADLSKNQALTNLRCEAGLKQLARLELFQCNLKRLSIPSSYEALYYLDLSHNKELEDVYFSGTCPSLQVLFLRNTGLRSFTLREGFQKLVYLYLNDNQLTEFEVEGTCYPELTTLQLKGNDLKGLSTSILAAMPALEALYLGGNKQLPSVLYAEIEDREDRDHLPEFRRYHAALQQGTPVQNDECKVLLIGNGGAGKTNIASRMTGGRFNPEWDSTHGILLKKKPLGDFQLNYWDFGGQKIYHSTHRLFMQQGAVYILAWSKDKEPGLSEGPLDYTDKNHPLHYWLDYAYHLGENSPVVVVQTKVGRDREHFMPLSEETEQRYQSLFDFLRITGVESDNRGAEGDESFDYDTGYVELRKLVLDAVKRIHQDEPIPLPYYRLRSLIRAEQEAGKETLSYEEYLGLVEKLKDENLSVEAPRELLEGWLFKSGVVYFRPERFSDQIILNQSWAIDAIYTLFNRKEFLHEDDDYAIPTRIERNNGRFSGKFLREIWDRKGYSDTHQEVFVGFMKSCDLCFEIEAEERQVDFEDRVFIAPQLLRDLKPMGIDAYWRDRPSVQYRYEDAFLHEGTMYAFIAQTAYLAELDGIWRRGIQISESGPSGRQVAYVEAQPKAICAWLSPNAQPLLRKIQKLIGKLQGTEGEEKISADGQRFVSMSEPLDLSRYFPKAQPSIEAPEHMGQEEIGKHPSHSDEFPSNRSKTLPEKEFEEVKEEAQSPPPQKQILFCSASPRDLHLIAHKDEFNTAYTELNLRQDRSQQRAFSFWEPLKAVDVLALQDALYQKPQVIHFAGHGTEKGIILDTDGSHGVLLHIDQVPRLFSSLQGTTELVILNACSSQAMAKTISQYNMYVIGTQFPIKNEPAISFAGGFYAGLGRTQDYQAAFNGGKLKVGTDFPKVTGIYEVWYQGETLDW